MSVDRQTTSDTSPASPGTAAGTVISGLDDFQSVVLFLTIQGATGGTLDVYLQFYDGVNWIDFAHFTQLAAGGAAVSYVVPINRAPRPADATPVVTGSDLTPALAADTIIHGTLTDRVRMVFVAGAGTSVGAAQVMTVVGTEERLEELQKQDLDLRVR